MSNGDRMLGSVERFFAHLKENFGTSVFLQIVVLDTSHELKVQDIKEASRILASHQEPLQMKISKVKEIPGYKFELLENWEAIDVKVVNIATKDEWGDIVHEEIVNKCYLEKDNLWGITLAKVNNKDLTNASCNRPQYQYVILLKFHHAICDAKSAFDVVYRQFLPILSAVVNKTDFEAILSKCLPLHNSIEETLGVSNKSWLKKKAIYLMKWIKENLFAKSLPEIASRQIVWKEEYEMTNVKVEKHSGCYPVIFSEELTTNIIHAAKKHNVSVHCVLTSVASVALCSACKDAGVELGQKIKQHFPIDLRKFLGIGSPQPLFYCVGGGISITENKCNHSDDEFWQMCKDIFEEVKSQNTLESCTAGSEAMEYSLKQHNNNWDRFIDNTIGFDNIAIISNLGNCDQGPEPQCSQGEVEFKVQEVYFAMAGPRERDTYIFFFGISTFNGKIMMSLQCNPEVVSKNFTQNLRLQFVNVATKYCNADVVTA